MRIGETHVVVPHAMLAPGADIARHAAEEERATEAVKRLVEAAKAMIEPPVWEEAQAELSAAVAPFTTAD